MTTGHSDPYQFVQSASEKIRAAKDALIELRDNGYGDTAVQFLNDLNAALNHKGEQKVNLNADNVNDNESSNTQADTTDKARHVSSAGSHGDIQKLPIDARGFPARVVKNRQLGAKLKADLILILIALNQSGILSSDIADEFKRLDIAEPDGTIKSRVSRLRSAGAISDLGRRNTGNYKLTEDGYKIAEEAVTEYNFGVDLPKFQG